MRQLSGRQEARCVSDYRQVLKRARSAASIASTDSRIDIRARFQPFLLFTSPRYYRHVAWVVSHVAWMQNISLPLAARFGRLRCPLSLTISHVRCH